MYLAWAECGLDVPGTGVAGVVRPSVQVLHHPVQPSPQVVLRPPYASLRQSFNPYVL